MITFLSIRMRQVFLYLLIGSSVLLTGCANFYLDPATRDVPASDMPKVAKPLPVKLNFEFQTRGAPNSRATEHLRSAVAEQIKASGLFASVDGPPNGAILDIKLNNIALGDGSPAAKGFVTGFTFGLVGSSVADGYECKISYLAPGQSVPIVKIARHAIHSTLGNARPPEGTLRTDNLEQAVQRMMHAIVGTALRDLAEDPAFPKDSL
jgi:hypothetical protein